MNVTRAALPVMRKQRAGLLVAISSTAGIAGQKFCTAYAAATFGNDSTTYAQPTVDGYAERTKEIVAAWKSMDGKQRGDPAKLAKALVTLVGLKEPPARFAAGADAVQTFEAKANTLLAQAQAHRELSASLARDDA